MELRVPLVSILTHNTAIVRKVRKTTKESVKVLVVVFCAVSKSMLKITIKKKKNL